MSLYVLCVLGGMALLAVLQFVAAYINGMLADWHRERKYRQWKQEQEIAYQRRLQMLNQASTRSWSDPAY